MQQRGVAVQLTSPPSTPSTWPVMKPARGPSRKATALTKVINWMITPPSEAGFGKTAEPMIATVSAAEAKLASAVTAGTLTQAQASTLESNLQTGITNLVNGTRPAGGRLGRFGGFGSGHAGNPGFGGGTGSSLAPTTSTAAA